MNAPAESAGPDGGTVVSARPRRTRTIANVSALVVFAVFVVVALLMRTDNAGASFGVKDQIFTVVVGLVAAGGVRLPARPRLRADASAVHLRSYLGTWRTIPWAAVRGVEFPSSARFARLVLPADEILAIYAVQRMDEQYAVDTMRALRALFAQTRPRA